MLRCIACTIIILSSKSPTLLRVVLNEMWLLDYKYYHEYCDRASQNGDVLNLNISFWNDLSNDRLRCIWLRIKLMAYGCILHMRFIDESMSRLLYSRVLQSLTDSMCSHWIIFLVNIGSAWSHHAVSWVGPVCFFGKTNKFHRALNDLLHTDL